MEIRSIGWEDFDAICALRLGRFDAIVRDPDYGMVSARTRPSPGELAQWFGNVHRDLRTGRRVSRIAVEEGQVLGLCSVVAEGDHPETEHVGVLGLEVRAGHHGRGIGRALLAATLEACRGKFELVDLAVIPENAAALHLYRSLGFIEYGRRPQAFRRAGRTHDFILMSRPVDPPAPP